MEFNQAQIMRGEGDCNACTVPLAQGEGDEALEPEHKEDASSTASKMSTPVETPLDQLFETSPSAAGGSPKWTAGVDSVSNAGGFSNPVVREPNRT